MKILISPGYGAGWSTWGCPEMATNKELISYFEEGVTKEQMEQKCIELGIVHENGKPYYMGGFDQLEVVDVPKGNYFKIAEYDGHESVEIMHMVDWIYPYE